ncbi:hypothetical protein B0H66DRAFT_213640 [Apodospora peruviana]|uniref:Uncharacterized protein n=1 Tax=Apodospora peruviana TaxID=516989 RepID=A0AAE0IEE0_9PEZI|nr:hypothetical protein B0H66DRAFT_213640 [Apodospora peruviana]
MAHPIQRDSPTPLSILSPPIPLKTSYTQLWGSLVRDPYTPTDKYSTFDAADTDLPIKLIPAIEDDTPLPIENYEEVINRQANAAAKLKLATIIKGWVQSSKSSTETRRGTRALFWFMKSPEDQFKKLMNDPKYNAQAKKLVTDILKSSMYKRGSGGDATKEQRRSVTVFFVSGMLALEEFEFESDAGKNKGAGFGAAAVEPKTGIKVAEGEAEFSRSADRSVGGTIKTPVIIALSYHEATLELRESTGFRARVKGLVGRKESSVTVAGTVAAISDDVWKGLTLKPERFHGDARFFDLDTAGEGNGHPVVDKGKAVEEVGIGQNGSTGNAVGEQNLLPNIYAA